MALALVSCSRQKPTHLETDGPVSSEAVRPSITDDLPATPQEEKKSAADDQLIFNQATKSYVEIHKLRAHALVPIAAHEDDGVAVARQEAVHLLAKSSQKEAVATVLEVLFLPANQPFWPDSEIVRHPDYKTLSKEAAYDLAMKMKYAPDLLHWSLFHIASRVEDAPPALKGLVYQAADLPVWRQWWEANKDNLRFKPKPSRPDWVDERSRAE